MTPAELDTMFREISEHEKLYRLGIEDVGKPLLKMEDQPSGIKRSMTGDRFSTLPPAAAKQSNEPADGYGPYPAPPIWVKRHSRFRTYPLHQMESFVELTYVYDGTARKEINGETLTLTRGQVAIIDSDAVHTTYPLDEEDILIIIQVEKSFFDSRFLTLLDTNSVLSSFFIRSISKTAAHDGYILFHSEHSRRLPIFMTEFFCEWFDPCDCHNRIITELFALIVNELSLVFANDVAAADTPHQSITLDVLRYIERDYRTCSLAEAADYFGMNPDSLSRLLKRETGSTFNQLVQQRRIAVAKLYLANGDLPVTAVARQVGYENVTFFYRVFERATGMKPGDYRKSVTQNDQPLQSTATSQGIEDNG